MHVVLAKAIVLNEAKKKRFKKYQEQIIKNSKALSKELKNLGFDILTGGTDNHMLILDLRRRNLTGKEVEKILEEVGITVNKNVIPNDPNPPAITSGIRIGTPAVTSRGMKEKEMRIIANFIKEAIEKRKNKKFLRTLKKEVIKFAKNYPAYIL